MVVVVVVVLLGRRKRISFSFFLSMLWADELKGWFIHTMYCVAFVRRERRLDGKMSKMVILMKEGQKMGLS